MEFVSCALLSFVNIVCVTVTEAIMGWKEKGVKKVFAQGFGLLDFVPS